jgi:hypothetical protein
VSEAPGGHGLAEVADAMAFLGRLTRLHPAALVRLRSDAGRTTLWARLPWAALVSRTVAGAGPGDATVSAAKLLAELSAGGGALPARLDAAWRWPLPPSAGRTVETIAAGDVRRIAAAAADTLRSAAAEGVGGRAVGQRALRDALLDHVAIVVAAAGGGAGEPSAGGSVEVSQRLVQAVVRMGFLGAPDAEREPRIAEGERRAAEGGPRVQVRLAGRWVGLAAPYGVAWLPATNQLAIRTSPTRLIG